MEIDLFVDRIKKKKKKLIEDHMLIKKVTCSGCIFVYLQHEY